MATLLEWQSVPSKLQSTFSTLNESLKADEQFLAFSDTNALKRDITFGWTSSGSTDAVICTVSKAKALVRSGNATEAEFILSARPEQWRMFYEPIPESPFQSYWGMFGQNIHQEGVEVVGNHDLFVQMAAIWRRVLELSHEVLHGLIKEDAQDEQEVDVIVGRYVFINTLWGRTKLFYEQCGDAGNVPILFLHTAGSDGRQYHGVMNDGRMLAKYHMTSIDLPGHGRSFPATDQIPGKHWNTEDAYVGCIREVITALGLSKPIVCGASMAGHICLAVATRADEVGAGGVIPCQAYVEHMVEALCSRLIYTTRSEHLDMNRQYWDKSPFVNQSLFNPEWIYGVSLKQCSPTNTMLIHSLADDGSHSAQKKSEPRMAYLFCTSILYIPWRFGLLFWRMGWPWSD